MISKVLLNKLYELREKSILSSNAYLFGFSYGSRLITRAAFDFGPRQIGMIHRKYDFFLNSCKSFFFFLFFFTKNNFITVCDPAGPGFDIHHENPKPYLAAQHSQCIHTDSKGHGTKERTCHQDWILGDCGIQQAAAG